jgi:hypothetical protein
MNESDNPDSAGSSAASEKDKTEKEALPEANEYVKRAAVVAWTNSAAEDVWNSDGSNYVPEKFHSYSDMSGNTNDYFIFVDDWGKWSAVAENHWKVEGIKFRRHDNFNTILTQALNMEVSYRPEEDVFIVSNPEWYSAIQREKNPLEDFDKVVATVPMSLVAEDRDAAKLDKLDKTDELPESKAITAFRRYCESMFPYGVKLHVVTGTRQQYQKADGSWYLEIEATVENQYGNKRDVVVSGYVNNVTGKVQDFSVK